MNVSRAHCGVFFLANIAYQDRCQWHPRRLRRSWWIWCGRNDLKEFKEEEGDGGVVVGERWNFSLIATGGRAKEKLRAIRRNPAKRVSSCKISVRRTIDNQRHLFSEPRPAFGRRICQPLRLRRPTQAMSSSSGKCSTQPCGWLCKRVLGKFTLSLRVTSLPSARFQGSAS